MFNPLPKLLFNKYIHKHRYKIYLCICFLFVTEANAQVFNKVGCTAPYETQSIGLYNGELLHCGFDTVCSVYVGGIGRWNNITWKGMNNSFTTGGVKGYAVHENDLYVAGGFWYMGGKQTNRIAKWNGTQWDSVGTGIQSNVEYLNALASYKGELYAGGNFNEIGGKLIKDIARWDGTQWKNVGSGISASLPQVYCMAVYKGELYVGGNIHQAGSVNANFIARWDGMKWRAVGKGANNVVLSMVVDSVRDVLYVGGYFSSVNDTIPGRVAMWDGAQWHQVGDPKMFDNSGGVMSMDMYHGYLYAAGISARGLVTDTCMARWDGEKWKPILGPNSTIFSIKTYQDELYIGGAFTRIGNDTIPYLARYYSPDTVVVGIRHEKRSPFGGDQEGALLVYPNPSNNRITILPIAIGTELIFEKFMVKDVMGKEILTITRPKQNQIDIALLPPGMYYLSATTKSREVYNATFIKE